MTMRSVPVGSAARLLAFLVLCMPQAWSAAAAHPALSLPQLKHVQWTRRDGAPNVMHSLAETPEGFLWMTSRDGLFRFDGRSFEAMDGGIDRAKYGLPRKLMVGRDGTLWVWYPRGWLAAYRQGRLRFVKAPSSGGEVISLNQTRDGAIWLGIAQIGKPFLRYHQEHWARVAPHTDRESHHDALESADGAFWLSFSHSVLRRPPKGKRFQRVPIAVAEGAQLTTDVGGAVWMVGPNGGRRLTGPAGRWSGAPSRVLHWRSTDPRWLRAEFDRDGNLWTMGRDFGRVPGLVAAERGGADHVAYEEGNIPQMTSRRPASLLIDRRGTVWYGGPRSLDRFSVPSVVSEPTLTNSARYGDVLYASPSGSVYIGQGDAVYRVDPHGQPARLFSITTPVEAMCGDREGAIWIILGDRIVRWFGGKQTRFARPPTNVGTYACGQDKSGRLWLTASTSGLFWRDGGRWRRVAPLRQDADFDPTRMWHDAQQDLWAWTGAEDITRIDGGIRETRSIAKPAQIGEITAPLPTSRGLLFAARQGAAFMLPSRTILLSDQQTKSLRGANSLVQSRQGYTWLFGTSELVRIRDADLKKMVATPGFVAPERIFSYEDGLPNGPNAQGGPAMVQGGDGRLWLATIDGIAWLDPARLPTNPVPPGVVITTLASGGNTIKDPAVARLEPGASDITIGFAALSLAMPERVSVRYRLEGHDRTWIDPGSRRQAFYTNLEPGDYRFQVIAANEDGVWNRAGDTLTLSIPPTFVQSWPFKLLCGLLVLALAWIAYAIRLRAVANRIRIRMAERIGERERIARELHDTLLQSAQSLTLRFQLAADALPPEIPVRPVLEQAIDHADQVIAEGRDRVRDLRPIARQAGIEQVIRGVVQRQAFPADVDVQIAVDGAPRTLDSLVLDELARIASEAIFNIWRHAGARHVQVDIEFHTTFTLRIADDGRGIEPEILRAGGRQDHFGLSGMRERALKLGGHVVIRRLSKGGSEVIVTIPGTIAYAIAPRGLRALRRLLRAKREAGLSDRKVGATER